MKMWHVVILVLVAYIVGAYYGGPAKSAVSTVTNLV
jgi:hypothetical protein